jgi:hypothetical protein
MSLQTLGIGNSGRNLRDCTAGASGGAPQGVAISSTPACGRTGDALTEVTPPSK